MLSASPQPLNAQAASAARSASPDRLLRIRDVQDRCGMGKTAIYAGIRDRSFPAAVKVGRSSRWLEREIQQFIAERAAARPQP